MEKVFERKNNTPLGVAVLLLTAIRSILSIITSVAAAKSSLQTLDTTALIIEAATIILAVIFIVSGIKEKWFGGYSMTLPIIAAGVAAVITSVKGMFGYFGLAAGTSLGGAYLFGRLIGIFVGAALFFAPVKLAVDFYNNATNKRRIAALIGMLLSLAFFVFSTRSLINGETRAKIMLTLFIIIYILNIVQLFVSFNVVEGVPVAASKISNFEYNAPNQSAQQTTEER